MSELKLRSTGRPQGDCVYCRDALAEPDPWECERCKVRLHRDCASHAAVCPTLGCGVPVEGAVRTRSCRVCGDAVPAELESCLRCVTTIPPDSAERPLPEYEAIHDRLGQFEDIPESPLSRALREGGASRSDLTGLIVISLLFVLFAGFCGFAIALLDAIRVGTIAPATVHAVVLTIIGLVTVAGVIIKRREDRSERGPAGREPG